MAEVWSGMAVGLVVKESRYWRAQRCHSRTLKKKGNVMQYGPVLHRIVPIQTK